MKGLPKTYGALFGILGKPLPEGVNPSEPVLIVIHGMDNDRHICGLICGRPKKFWPRNKDPGVLDIYSENSTIDQIGLTRNDWKKLGVRLDKVDSAAVDIEGELTEAGITDFTEEEVWNLEDLLSEDIEVDLVAEDKKLRKGTKDEEN